MNSTIRYKETIWVELKINEFKIISKASNGTLLIESDKLPRRRRWFIESRKGNYYSRYTGKSNDYYAEGYIIKKEIIEEMKDNE